MNTKRNTIAVSGSPALLKAFEEELLNMGFKNNNPSISNCKYILVNKADGQDWLKNGFYIYQNSYASKRIPIELPNDWVKAIDLVTFKEELIPTKEYREILNLGDSDIEFTITPKGIFVDGNNINIDKLSLLYETMLNFKIDPKLYFVSFPNVKTGCSLFTIEEIRKIIFTYKKVCQESIGIING